MISEVFRVLRDALIDHIRHEYEVPPEDSTEEPVLFFNSDKLESVEFRRGAVTMMLVNLEEDRMVRPADPYRRIAADGTTELVKPPVPLNLYVLFVARFGDYLESLRHIAFVVKFFQKYRSIDRDNMPDLDPEIDSLVCDLISNPIHEHNQVWSALNTAYQPSLLYRIKMVIFEDSRGVPVPAVSSQAVTVASRKAYWAYYVLTNLAEDTAWRIVDTVEKIKPTDDDPVLFANAAKKVFKRTTAAAEFEKDPLAAYLIRNNPTLQCVRIVSDEPVMPFRKKRPKIELRMGAGGVVRPLPNPAPRDTSMLTLDAANGSSRDIEAQVHILRYIAKT